MTSSRKSGLESEARRLLLERFGSDPILKDALEFFSEHAPDIGWVPSLIFEVPEGYWGFEIIRGDFISDDTAAEMKKVEDSVKNFTSVVVVPNGEDEYEIKATADKYELILMVNGERGFVFDSPNTPTPDPTTQFLSSSRIPSSLRDELRALPNLDSKVQQILVEFAQEHEQLEAKGINDEAEFNLLNDTLEKLLRCDDRFEGTAKPLFALRAMEQVWAAAGLDFRDHFFHSFQDFFLGCQVLNGCHDLFQKFLRLAFPSAQNMSPEYVWILISFFHDVGYLVQRGDDVITRLRFGQTDSENNFEGTRDGALAEHEVVIRKTNWEYQSGYRKSLTSLYDHLTQDEITEDWVLDTLSPPAPHPLDDALKESYMSEKSHGAASALRLLNDISAALKEAPNPDKPFLMKHAYLAALSIPFHDWRARSHMIDNGIDSVLTSRFPFACLLAFIDSIQDDRRDVKGSQHGKQDVLLGIEIEGNIVTAIVETPKLSETELGKKKEEADGVKAFFEQDGLQFVYPPDFS